MLEADNLLPLPSCQGAAFTERLLSWHLQLIIYFLPSLHVSSWDLTLFTGLEFNYGQYQFSVLLVPFPHRQPEGALSFTGHLFTLFSLISFEENF
jgi:hypothetical protein